MLRKESMKNFSKLSSPKRHIAKSKLILPAIGFIESITQRPIDSTRKR